MATAAEISAAALAVDTARSQRDATQADFDTQEQLAQDQVVAERAALQSAADAFQAAIAIPRSQPAWLDAQSAATAASAAYDQAVLDLRTAIENYDGV